VTGAAQSGQMNIADLVEKVKPAVVAVKVNIQTAADTNDEMPFAMPDVPMLIDEIGLPQVPELTPPSQRMQLLGRGGGPAPTRVASLTPPILVSGVPEPGSWLLMILGFGGAGALLRRSRMRASRLAASR